MATGENILAQVFRLGMWKADPDPIARTLTIKSLIQMPVSCATKPELVFLCPQSMVHNM